ncbi:hypothetical protein T069G_03245 [Trichoderma breve]|uniref:Uncharacterized protein n=1 Tax=Trichoderma breve TaxID=2034170 RepID=A0A9W9BM60_9HYPO|nr:hypothetical protein T069G_03245 [Trichoderma breve]KAJ4862291.1 hypothetical protein T069G_03245 [Trichoderma breve]
MMPNMPNTSSTQDSASTQQDLSIKMPENASSQYHHFVPQFLLKNFVDACNPTKNGSTTSTNRRARRRKRNTDPTVNRVDLSSEMPEVIEIPVKRILGKTDMYRDTNKPCAEQQHVERMFGDVESRTSRIFRKITKAFDEGHRGIWITRDERNLVRKFLFLMKYRGPAFYGRYNHETASDYDANDRERMLEYMQKKGFERPIDVWFDNIKTIIELDMDDELNWISELPERMYPDDAKWAIMHCQSFFMAICTPSNAQDEFLLTDNCYHVSEGVFQCSVSLETGESKVGAWTNFHEFAPISPKLMIVLRSFLLPSPEEDSLPGAKAEKEMLWSLVVERFHGSDVNSTLADLPIAIPDNNYSHKTNGVLQFQDENFSLQRHHKFFFSFFPIETHHVNKIHCVFLDNASSCTSVIFRSKESFRQTLEWYLTEPGWVGKRVTSLPGDRRRLYLLKLAAVLKQLGSDKEPTWEEIDVAKMRNDTKRQLMEKGLFELFPELLDCIPDDNPSEFMQIYNSLGGSKQTITKDMRQVYLMMELRIKIDVWSRGLDEALRVRNRKLLMDAYTRLPSHRFWLYTKYWRAMESRDPSGPRIEEHAQPLNVNDDGPEDAIARARDIIKPSKLNFLMKVAVGNDIKLKKKPGYNLSWKFTIDESGAENFMMIQALAFHSSIRDCGIEAIETLATIYGMAVVSQFDLEIGGCEMLNLTEGETVELFVRMLVREDFEEMLQDKLETNVLNDLAKVFFELIYPHPKTDT